MLVIALALVLLAAACAVVLIEASRSVIPTMAPIVRQTAPVAPINVIPAQRLAGELGSAKADSAHRAYAFIAELPAEKTEGFDSSL